jgi:universal stress protein family protein
VPNGAKTGPNAAGPADARRVVARARAAGAQATFLVWEGDPAEAIIEASEAEHADLIVLDRMVVASSDDSSSAAYRHGSPTGRAAVS